MSGESAPTPDLNEQIIAIAEPKLVEAAERIRGNFMTKFGEFVESSHKDKLEELFKDAADAKIKCLMQTDTNLARQWAQVYESKVRAMETLGLGSKVVADAKAASFLMETVHLVLDTLGDIAMSIIKGVTAGLVSGAINALTGGAAGAIGGSLASAAGSFLDSAVGDDDDGPSES